MKTFIVRTTLTEDEVLRRINALPSIVGGNDYLARRLQLTVATQTMSILKREFIKKSRGGVDEAGESWEPLAPYTIKKRLEKIRGPLARKLAKIKRARRAKSKRKAQIEYANALAISLDMLRDTGRLYNSLSPGASGTVMPDGIVRYGVGDIVIGTNVKYAWDHHHDGERTYEKGEPFLPQRRLWPKPEQWPSQWWQQINQSLRHGVVEIIKDMMR